MAKRQKTDFGRMLERFRKRERLTQEQVARLIPMSESYMGKLERGESKLPEGIENVFADVLDLDEEERLSLGEAARRAREVAAVSMSKETRERLPSLPQRNPPVGRDSKVEEIKMLLQQSGAIVCIVGEPAIGKTTVAAEIAHQLRDQGKVVIWGDARDGEAKTGSQVEQLLWNALVGEERPKDQTQRLNRVRGLIAGFKALLILDNLESAEDFTEILSYLARLAPPATVLLTSRRHIPARLGTNVSLRELKFEDGISLFKRIGDRQGRRVETGGDDEIIELICTRYLQEHPGAIEIAAALWGAWPLREILRGLDRQAMETLEDSERTDINRSMRLSIGLSYALLAQENGEASELFPCLSVFRASFDHTAVEEVCETDKPLPLLGLLVNRSLVRFDRERYSLHAVVREYGDERLGDRRELCGLRAALYFLDYVTRYGKEFDALEVEKGNLFAVMEWCEERGEHHDLGLEFVHLLQDFMDKRGYWEERLRRSEGALRIAELLEDKEEMARLSFLIGATYGDRGELEEAERYHKQGLELARVASDQDMVGRALLLLAGIACDREEWDKARRWARQAAQLGEASQIGTLLLLVYSLRVSIEKGSGNLDLAYQYAERELESAQAVGDLRPIRLAQQDLWEMALALGDYERAAQHLEAYRTLAEESGDPVMLGEVDFFRGMQAQKREQWSESEARLLSALSALEAHSAPVQVAAILEGLALAAEAQDDLAGAEKYMVRFISVMRSVGHLRETANGLKRLGGIQEELGKFEEARASYEEAWEICRDLGLVNEDGGRDPETDSGLGGNEEVEG